MATGMKTAQTCITNAEQIIAEFADKLTDEGRADLAAVVAMAKCRVLDRALFRNACLSRGEEEWIDNTRALHETSGAELDALEAAGCEPWITKADRADHLRRTLEGGGEA